MSSVSRAPFIYVAAGAIGMAAAMGIGRFVYTPILPGMMDGLGLSASDAGLIASANYAGYLLGAVLASGRWGQGRERGVVLLSLLANAVLAAAMGAMQGLAVFLLVRFLAGIASAFVMVFISTIVFQRLIARGRADLQAWHFGGVGAGIAMSSVMIAALVLAGAEWQAGWIWSGALSLAGLILVFLMIEPVPAPAQKPPAEPGLPKNPALTRIIVAYGLFGFGYIITATFLVAIVRQGEAGRLFESVVWLATGLAGIPSVWLWAIAARRWGLASVFAVGCVVEAIGVVASVALGGYAGPLIGGVLLGGTFIAITAMGLQFGRQLAGEAPRRVIALMTAAFGVGQIAGPVVAGVVADRSGDFVLASLIAAVVLLVSGFVAYGAGKRA